MERDVLEDAVRAEVVVQDGVNGVREVVIEGEDGHRHGAFPPVAQLDEVVQVVGGALRHDCDVMGVF